MNSAVAQTALPPEWSAAAWAQRLIEQPEQPPSDFSIDQALAVAWALKDACYAAWSSQPQRAGPAAQAVGLLRQQAQATAEVPADAYRELSAVAHWTEGIALITASRMDEAAAVLDRAAAEFTALRQANHAAQTQVPRIMALTMTGRHAEAAACGEATQKEFLRLGDTRSAGKVSLNLGGLQLARDDHRNASVHYRQATVLFARSGDIEHSVMADIGLGKALSAVGELEEAVRIYSRARMRAQAHDLPMLQAMAEEGVAVLELARGRYRDALQGFERARRSFEALKMPQYEASSQLQLGEAYLELRLLPEALTQFDSSLNAMRELGMLNEQAWAQLSNARALALLGRVEQVEPLLRESANSFSNRGNGVGLALVTLAQAELMLALNQAEKALVLADTASLSLRAQGQAEPEIRAEATAAHALLKLGQSSVSRARFDAALQRSRALQLLQSQVQCLTGLGLAAQIEKNDLLASEHFTSAIELFEEQRRALPCDEMRSSLMADHLRPYQELLRMALNRQPADSADVLQRLDHLHARALSERLLQGGRQVGSDSSIELRVRLNWLYRHLNGRGEDIEPSPALAAELKKTELELLERARRDRLLDAGALPTEPAAVFDPWKLARTLGPADAVVEYGVLDDELFACVVRDDGVRVVRRLSSWVETRAAIRAARFQIDTMRYGEGPLAGHLGSLHRRAMAHLQRLHGLIWAPMLNQLQGCQRVLVVPHGELGAVPFAALHDGQQWLGMRHEIALAPSAQIGLSLLAPWTGAPRSVLALGESTRLLHASGEARSVAALFENGVAAVDDQASIQSLRALSVGADVIHLACHAEFRRDNPMFSALHLTDGPLTAELVEGLSLPGTVVVLSACETGLAGQTSGDELVGLVRAFMIAGATRVVASLWPVDDAVTVQFMRQFYQGLRAGRPPGNALQAAQNGLRANHPHPFAWAPFVLHGAW